MHMGTNARIICKVLTKYRNTFYALKELINNSIMAKATRIEISFIPKGQEADLLYQPISEVVLKDNGYGVAYSDFYKSIMEVGTDNRTDGLGIGRFGGLQIGRIMTIETVAYDHVCKAYTKTTVTIKAEDLKGDDLSNKEFEVKREILKLAENSYYKVHIGDLYHYDSECSFKNKLVKDFYSVEEFSNKLFQHYPLYIFDEKVTFIVNGKELNRLDFVKETPRNERKKFIDVYGNTHSIDFYFYSLKLEDTKIRLFLQVTSGDVATTALELTYNSMWYSPIMGAQYVIVKSEYITKDLCDNFAMIDFREKEWDSFATFIREEIDEYYKKGDIKYNTFLEELSSDRYYPFDEDDVKTSPLLVDVFNKSAFYLEEDLKLLQNNSADKKLIYSLLKKVIESGDIKFLVQHILGLSKESQRKMIELIDRSNLEDIVEFSTKVAQRLSVIDFLHYITVVDLKNSIELLKKIDTIMTKELWILGEEYSNSLANVKDTNLESLLNELFTKYISIKPSKKWNNLLESSTRSLRLVEDSVIYNERQIGNGTREILAVNFRRPSCYFNQTDINQIDSYIYAIQSQSQFVKRNTQYRLFFIVHEISDYARSRISSGKSKEEAFLYQEIDELDVNIKAYIVPWSELISFNRHALSCMSDTLRIKQVDAQAMFQAEYSSLMERKNRGRLSVVGEK